MTAGDLLSFTEFQKRISKSLSSPTGAGANFAGGGRPDICAGSPEASVGCPFR
jgi:hypothetical protein